MRGPVAACITNISFEILYLLNQLCAVIGRQNKLKSSEDVIKIYGSYVLFHQTLLPHRVEGLIVDQSQSLPRLFLVGPDKSGCSLE